MPTNHKKASGLFPDEHETTSLDLISVTADPSPLADGMVWYRSDLGKLRARIGGATVSLAGAFADLTGKPTTLAGYEITDAKSIPSNLPASGEFVATCVTAQAASLGTVAGTAGILRLYPVQIANALTISELSIRCSTAVASALGKIVVYSADASGNPDALLFESGDLDLSTTGVKAAAWNRTFSQGTTIWIGLRHSSTAATWSWAQTQLPYINGGTALAATSRSVLERNITYATAAPGTWGWTSSEISNGTPAAIWLKRA